MGCAYKKAAIRSIVYQLPKSKQYQTTKNTIINDQKKSVQRLETKEEEINNLVNGNIKKIHSTQFLYSNLPHQSKNPSMVDADRMNKHKINSEQILKKISLQNKLSKQSNASNPCDIQKSLKSKTIQQQRKINNDSIPSVPQSYIKAIAQYDQTNYDELHKYLSNFNEKVPAQININRKELQKGKIQVKINFN